MSRIALVAALTAIATARAGPQGRISIPLDFTRRLDSCSGGARNASQAIITTGCRAGRSGDYWGWLFERSGWRESRHFAKQSQLGRGRRVRGRAIHQERRGGESAKQSQLATDGHG